MKDIEIIELEHNSQAWLDFRNTGIGGSDASAVLGLNPWKTNVELWEEKSGLKPPKEVSCAEAVEYGSKAEAWLAKLFELDFPEYRLTTPKNIVYRRDGFMFASLDGELEDRAGRKGILEIKTSTIFSSINRERWNEKIPQNYYIQLLHYLMVTGYDFAILKAQLKSSQQGGVYLQTRHYCIDVSDESVKGDIRYLREAERTFWEDVKTKKRPALILPI